MEPRTILIHGRKGVGKDTLASYIEQRYGHIPIAIADVLKDYLMRINPLVLDYMGDTRPLNSLLDEGWETWDTVKRKNPYVRHLLKTTGQTIRELFGEDIWVSECIARIEMARQAFPQFKSIVVTDIRYWNELEMLRSKFPGAVTVKIVRSDHDSDGHPSEDGLPDEAFDMVLENNEGLAELFSTFDTCMGLWIAEARLGAAA